MLGGPGDQEAPGRATASGVPAQSAKVTFEPPSTRVLVTAAQLIAAGATELDAADACILAPLSTDGAVTDGLREVAAASLAASDISVTPR